MLALCVCVCVNHHRYRQWCECECEYEIDTPFSVIDVNGAYVYGCVGSNTILAAVLCVCVI